MTPGPETTGPETDSEPRGPFAGFQHRRPHRTPAGGGAQSGSHRAGGVVDLPDAAVGWGRATRLLQHRRHRRGRRCRSAPLVGTLPGPGAGGRPGADDPVGPAHPGCRRDHGGGARSPGDQRRAGADPAPPPGGRAGVRAAALGRGRSHRGVARGGGDRGPARRAGHVPDRPGRPCALSRADAGRPATRSTATRCAVAAGAGGR